MKKIIYLFVLSIVSINVYSQKLKVAKADKEFDKFAYIDAIKTYERLFEKGYKSVDMFQKLGNAYYFNADLENAEKWYSKLFVLTQNVDPEYYFRYAQSLKAIKIYNKADELLLKFNKKSGNETRAKLANSQKDYLAQIKKNSGRYVVEDAGINSEYSDYGSTFYNGKVIFTSARDTGNLSSRKHKWTGESFTNLYDATIGTDSLLSKAERFSKKINSKFHESTPAFTKDGKTVYFTRNNYIEGKKGKSNNRSTFLKIYKATFKNEQWSDVTELPFNSDQYSTAHPSLSYDETTLYFASEMPGSIGQSDLYKVIINQDGTFGKPENLGTTINTEGRETFPMITKENELYFASDGHPGLGGLDIFVSKNENDKTFRNVMNVGEPINSAKDDFGFLIDEKTRIGFVSSNRNGGKGNDDIYKFKETKKIEYPCEQVLYGIVTDEITGLPLAKVKVSLFDIDHKKLNEVYTNNEGKYDFGMANCQTKYYILTEYNNYNTKETPTITANESRKTFVPIALEKTLQSVKTGDDLAKVLKINIIYFDLDNSTIRKDAAIDLAKILDVLIENPTMEIDIRSHTDCRQTAKYNLELSDRRAKSTMKWLILNGIANSRITAKGYGESQLVNNCECEPTNKSTCTEDQHQANRRSEFIITKM